MRRKGFIIIFFIVVGVVVVTVATNFVVLEGMRRKRLPYAFPVDAVVTWVDADDPAWQRKKTSFSRKQTSENLSNADVPHRFENVNELYYCLKGITVYLPWIRKIFLVTMKPQRPSFLKQFPKVRLVHHEAFFQIKNSLPTFNSMAIETQLHHISGLAECFIYFNDDSFIGKPLGKNFFFTPAGEPHMYDRLAINQYQKRTHDVLRKHNMEPQHIAPLHQAVPLTKSLFKDVWDLFGKELTATAQSRFRRRKDVVTVGLVYQVCDRPSLNRTACLHFTLDEDEELYMLLTKQKQAYTPLETYAVAESPPSLICINNIQKQNKNHRQLWKKFITIYDRNMSHFLKSKNQRL